MSELGGGPGRRAARRPDRGGTIARSSGPSSSLRRPVGRGEEPAVGESELRHCPRRRLSGHGLRAERPAAQIASRSRASSTRWRDRTRSIAAMVAPREGPGTAGEARSGVEAAVEARDPQSPSSTAQSSQRSASGSGQVGGRPGCRRRGIRCSIMGTACARRRDSLRVTIRAFQAMERGNPRRDHHDRRARHRGHRSPQALRPRRGARRPDHDRRAAARSSASSARTAPARRRRSSSCSAWPGRPAGSGKVLGAPLGDLATRRQDRLPAGAVPLPAVAQGARGPHPPRRAHRAAARRGAARPSTTRSGSSAWPIEAGDVGRQVLEGHAAAARPRGRRSSASRRWSSSTSRRRRSTRSAGSTSGGSSGRPRIAARRSS